MSEITTTITLEEVQDLYLKLLSKHQSTIILDKEEFLDLLENSLSLDLADKKRVLDTVPTLTQFQFDELKKVFVEEREKFRELAGEHPEDIKKLYAKQRTEWFSLAEVYKKEAEISSLQIEAESKKDEEQAQIDDLKASLGL